MPSCIRYYANYIELKFTSGLYGVHLLDGIKYTKGSSQHAM